jgi:hypothetical protein
LLLRGIIFTRRTDELTQHAQFQFRQALDASGPTYPAWINRQALTPATGPDELNSNDELRWSCARGA